MIKVTMGHYNNFRPPIMYTLALRLNAFVACLFPSVSDLLCFCGMLTCKVGSHEITSGVVRVKLGSAPYMSIFIWVVVAGKWESVKG